MDAQQCEHVVIDTHLDNRLSRIICRTLLYQSVSECDSLLGLIGGVAWAGGEVKCRGVGSTM